MAEVINAIKRRRSIRRYSASDVSDLEVRKLLEAAMYAPSANHLDAWHFIVVKDIAKREALSQTTPWAGFVAGAPIVIVVCSEDSREWIEDASIASEHIALEAVDIGLGTCIVQVRGHATGRVDAEEHVRRILNIPDGIRVLFLLPVGRPAENKSPHDIDELREDRIHKDVW